MAEARIRSKQVNNQLLEKKIQNDIADIRSDLNGLMEMGIPKASSRFEQLKRKMQQTLSGAAVSVKNKIESVLAQYNANAQGYADKTLGGFGGFVRKYPWVVITGGLGIGILLGGLLKPSRRS